MPLLAHLRKLLNRLLQEPKFRQAAPDAFDRVITELAQQTQQVALAAEGITIAGQTAQDVRVLHNTVTDSLQGVHVGLRYKDATRQATVVTIAGNTLQVALSPWAVNQDRHGIFVGNCRSLLIENNNLRLNRLPATTRFSVDSIRMWGELGERLLITKNYAASADDQPRRSFTTGIRVVPLTKKPATARWVAMWNVAPSQHSTVSVKNGAVNLANTNMPN